MVNLNLSTTILLPALAAAGVVTTMVFSVNNGMFPKITEIIEDPNATTFPGTDVPFSREWTGVAALDKQLTVLLIFFYQLLDGKYPSATLQVLIPAPSTTLFGLVYQNISVAITIPVWALVHLLTLPPTNSTALRARLSVAPDAARLLPWAMFLGYMLPSFAMVAPSPYQQALIALWQPFPLWATLIATLVLRPLFSSSSPSPTSPPSPQQSYAATSSAHLFALLLAAIPHAAALSLSLGALALPQLFAPATAASLHPARVFLPKLSTTPGDAVPLAEGVLRFMQWDEAVSTAATVVWAATVYLRDTRISGGSGRFGIVGVVVRVVGWTVVGGPAAAAVALVWARDEVVFGSGSDGKRG
ncbi:hypothetical protein SLS57_010263 [Botryosphaeria dothidea]